MRVFIYACENIYGGLHGINNLDVCEVKDLDEANEIGMDMSIEVCESYDDVLNQLEEDADCAVGEENRDTDEWCEAYNQALCENLNWYCEEINEEVAGSISTEELGRIACNLGDEEFVERYCKRD